MLMLLEELRNEVYEAMKQKPDYIRKGQFVFNYIDEKYGVARAIQFIDHVDCFYDDKNITAFLTKAVERINSEPTEEWINLIL